MKAIISSVSMEKKTSQLLEESFTGSARVPYLKTGSRLIRLCVFVSFLAMTVISGIAQTTSGSYRAYVYETPSPPAVYTEIMRDMQENDYTVLYRYVARQMFMPMKNLIFIPIFNAKPTDISDPLSFIMGFQLEDYSRDLLTPCEARQRWFDDWDSFGLLEKWKFPRFRKISKQFHSVIAVQVYRKDGILLTVYSMGNHKFHYPDREFYVQHLGTCPSAKFLLRIDNALGWYLFFEDACHYRLLGRSQGPTYDTPTFELSSFERLYEEVLLTKKKFKEDISRRKAEKEAQSLKGSVE